jgi:DNA-directed RNA polymerase subunit M/transcription elongation factor TFIIS
MCIIFTVSYSWFYFFIILQEVIMNQNNNNNNQKRTISKRKCRACGGALRFAGNYSKSSQQMITYRICTKCGRKWKWIDRCEEEIFE